MPLTSDLQINVSKFDPRAISEQTKKLNDGLINLGKSMPNWWEVGAEKFRQMRWNGETPLPRPTVLESARDVMVPSREAGRSIPCRVFVPASADPKGVFYHIHGGGWVLQSEKHADLAMQHMADQCALVVVSVGYRLAPEHPYPAGNEDCFDVGEYLVDNAERDHGVPLLFLGGDSAGAHLSSVTCFHLLSARPDFAFRGLVLNFGAYDLSGWLPHVHHFDTPLVLQHDVMQRFIEAYLPGKTEADKRDMWISPFYANMYRMKLPPVLFNCGTLDPLLDDSIMMATKWMTSGAECYLKIYPGAPHGFNHLPLGGTETTQDCWDNVTMFLNERSS